MRWRLKHDPFLFGLWRLFSRLIGSPFNYVLSMYLLLKIITIQKAVGLCMLIISLIFFFNIVGKNKRSAVLCMCTNTSESTKECSLDTKLDFYIFKKYVI